MAKKIRFDGAVEAFASESLSTERTIFGDTTQSDDIDDNLNADFLRGWGIVGVNDLPTKQDFNAMAYTLGYLLSYLYQQGVAEWNAIQDYHTGQIVNVSGELYKSLQNNNTNKNPLSEPTWWSKSGATGDMLKSENLSGLADYAVARDNLGVLGVKGSSITRAATTNIGNADSHFVDLTGTTTITSFGTGGARNMVMVNFTGVGTLTHNATSLILPGAANITTAAGDTAIFVRNGASGSANWRCIAYQRASGLPIINPTLTTADMPAGVTIDRAIAEYTAATGLTTILPTDDTIPQNTEGNEILSASITPKKSTNRIRATFHGFLNVSPATANASAAMFRDDSANAINASSGATGNTGRPWQVSMQSEFVVGSTTPKTVTVRVGPSAAGTAYVNNATAGTRAFGGIARATLILEEIQT